LAYFVAKDRYLHFRIKFLCFLEEVVSVEDVQWEAILFPLEVALDFLDLQDFPSDHLVHQDLQVPLVPLVLLVPCLVLAAYSCFNFQYSIQALLVFVVDPSEDALPDSHFSYPPIFFAFDLL